MRFKDYILMALRNIWRQKLRSVLTIFAIVIGATSVTIMLATVFSLKSFMIKQLESNGVFQQVAVSPQTDISWDNRSSGGNCNDCTKLTDDLASKIAARPHVTGVARQTNMWQFEALTFGTQKLRTEQMVAYDANGVLVDDVVAGRSITDADKEGVVTLSSDYADKLGFKHNYQGLVGKQIGLFTSNYYTGAGSDPKKQAEDQQAWFSSHPGADGRDYKPQPVTLTATVIGITQSERDRYTIRVPLAWARGMQLDQRYEVTPAAQQAAQAACQAARTPNCNSRGEPTLTTVDMLAKNGYNSFVVKVDKASNAASVAKDIRSTYKVGAADAQSQIKQELSIFNILGLVLGGIGGIALIVAAVGVVNTMVMAILERTREIGVMRAVGARRSTVSRVFTFEASLLGFLGGVVGLAVGYGLVLLANPFINKQLQSNNIQSANIIMLPLWLVIGVVALTTAIGLLAGLYPARRAAKLDPVEALHYE